MALKIHFFQNWAWDKTAQNFKESDLGNGWRQENF